MGPVTQTSKKNRHPITNVFPFSTHYVNNVLSEHRLDTFNSMNIINFKCEGEREIVDERQEVGWLGLLNVLDGCCRILMSPLQSLSLEGKKAKHHFQTTLSTHPPPLLSFLCDCLSIATNTRLEFLSVNKNKQNNHN